MNQKRFFFGLMIAGLAALPFVSGRAVAGPSVHLSWGSQLNQSQCGTGTLVVNVVEKVLNDDDSGMAGNNWALDDYVRHIQVVETAPSTFCARVTYQGDFTTVAGASPGDTGTVAAGVTGTFQGGYIAQNFTGTLNPSPTYPTFGNIGSFDYQCDASSGVCPGYQDWTTIYFSTPSGFNLDWWGWVY